MRPDGGGDPAAASGRAADIAAGLRDVQDRLAAACASAGRLPESVRLVVVTKTWPLSDVEQVVRLGARDLGENRDDEAAAKAGQLSALVPDLRWHFLGQLQSRKARSVASYATTVQSIDRDRAADALSAGADRAGRTVEVMLQLSLDGDPRRGGVVAEALLPLADRVAGLPGLRLVGLMAAPPRSLDPAGAFATVTRHAERLRTAHPGAAALSLGMSDDLEAAVSAGSTMVRVGTAVLGPRRTMLR